MQTRQDQYPTCLLPTLYPVVQATEEINLKHVKDTWGTHSPKVSYLLMYLATKVNFKVYDNLSSAWWPLSMLEI